MLIPELHEASACFVALDETNRVIGAAARLGRAVLSHRSAPESRCTSSSLAVGKGIGRRLLQCLERAAEGEGAQAVYGASRVEQGSDAMRGWQWLGFTPCETVETQRLPLDQFEPRLARSSSECKIRIAFPRRHELFRSTSRIMGAC